MKGITQTSSPLISVSIVSHGHGPFVKRLLSSIAAYEMDLDAEIIITENAGDGFKLPNEVGGLNTIQIQNKHPRGFAENHNNAFHRARGEYFCLLNPDTSFVEQIFPKLLQHIQAGRGDVVAPMIVDDSGRLQDSFRDLPTPLELTKRRILRQTTLDRSVLSGELVSPDWIAAIFLLMRADTYRKLGGLNERYYLYFEDVDFCCRARLAGLTLLVDTRLKVIHNAQRASRRDPRYLAWHLQSAWRFFTSHVYWQTRRI
jgi:N-acetylglucosaminyl-diphospho-decaprenol L-rhamnosyltransferase